MTPFVSSLAIAGGAAIGANARFWFGHWWTGKYPGDFPWHTLLINATGSLVLGAFMALALARGWGTGWRLFVAVGFAGGFTTFSTFSAEAMDLFEKNKAALAAGYMVSSVAISVLACWAGLHFARVLVER